jgi:hypothetical protein
MSPIVSEVHHLPHDRLAADRVEVLVAAVAVHPVGHVGQRRAGDLHRFDGHQGVHTLFDLLEPEGIDQSHHGKREDVHKCILLRGGATGLHDPQG